MEQRRPNALAGESSPYLLQHAFNPVEWNPWGEEALAKAKRENKPILVSIGYSACHWCHVMEKESFEDEGTARVMNEHFVNIKIDREERPDLDHIYMDAVQAMTGRGGWPLNVFLTPDRKPFYGGTYFPPVRMHNRASWKEVLEGVARAFAEKRDQVEDQAAQLTAHLEEANAFGLSKEEPGGLLQQDSLDQLFANCMKSADREWGGFGQAPKFPQTFLLRYLLRYHAITGNKEALAQVRLSLNKMIEGGIYDQLGGGFARYSTDSEWLAPHFEKMLYDNALLVVVLAEAWQLTREPRYREVIEETMEFVQRELLHESGGFCAALDADSEGVEGKYYTWQKPEIDSILGAADAAVFCGFYGVTAGGNWEGTNILTRRTGMADYARDQEMTEEALGAVLAASRKKLLAAREKRVRPGLDDKIILGWNALMNQACCAAYAVTGNPHWRTLAVRNMTLLLREFRAEDGTLLHTWKNGKARYPGFLDDYACMIHALIQLQEITANPDWLLEARALTYQVLDRFSDEDGLFFYFTARDQEDVIVRKKEMYDGAVPSGNAQMAGNLQLLAVYFDMPKWRDRSDRMLTALGTAIVRYPSSFGVWASVLAARIRGLEELVVTASEEELEVMLKELLSVFLPFRVLMGAAGSAEQFPLLRDKKMTSQPLLYRCFDYTCSQPVFSVSELLAEMGKTIRI